MKLNLNLMLKNMRSTTHVASKENTLAAMATEIRGNGLKYKLASSGKLENNVTMKSANSKKVFPMMANETPCDLPRTGRIKVVEHIDGSLHSHSISGCTYHVAAVRTCNTPLAKLLVESLFKGGVSSNKLHQLYMDMLPQYYTSNIEHGRPPVKNSRERKSLRPHHYVDSVAWNFYDIRAADALMLLDIWKDFSKLAATASTKFSNAEILYREELKQWLMTKAYMAQPEPDESEDQIPTPPAKHEDNVLPEETKDTPVDKMLDNYKRDLDKSLKAEADAAEEHGNFGLGEAPEGDIDHGEMFDELFEEGLKEIEQHGLTEKGDAVKSTETYPLASGGAITLHFEDDVVTGILFGQ